MSHASMTTLTRYASLALEGHPNNCRLAGNGQSSNDGNDPNIHTHAHAQRKRLEGNLGIANNSRSALPKLIVKLLMANILVLDPISKIYK